MPPIRKGDGTAVAPKGISQVRTGDGRVLFDSPAIPYPYVGGNNGTVTQLDSSDLSTTGNSYDDGATVRLSGATTSTSTSAGTTTQ